MYYAYGNLCFWSLMWCVYVQVLSVGLVYWLQHETEQDVQGLKDQIDSANEN